MSGNPIVQVEPDLIEEKVDLFSAAPEEDGPAAGGKTKSPKQGQADRKGRKPIDQSTTAKASKGKGRKQKERVGPLPRTGGLEAVTMRRMIYLSANSLLQKIVLGEAIVIAVLGLALWQVATRTLQPPIIGLTSDMRVMELTPLSDPKLSNAQVVNWATRAISEVYSFDYVNYRDEIQASGSTYFTPQGYQSFVKELGDSGVLDQISEGQYIMTTAVTSTPIIVSEGQFDGRHAWKVQVPVIITLQNAETNSSINRLAEMVAIRTYPMSNNQGIAISRFVIRTLDK